MKTTKSTMTFKIIILIAAIFLIVSPIFTVIVYREAESAMLKEIELEGLSIATLASDKLTGNPVDDRPIVEQVGKIDNIVYALTINTDFKAVTHSNKDRVGMEFKDSGTETAMSGSVFTGKYYSKDRKMTIYDVIVPIKNKGGQTIAAFNIGISMGNINIIKYSIIIGIVSLSLLIIGVVSLFLNIYIKPKLKRLAENIRRLAELDFTKQEMETSNDEIGVVYEALNDMNEKMHNIIQEISARASDVYSTSSVITDSINITTEQVNQITLAIEEVANGAVKSANSASESQINLVSVSENFIKLIASAEGIKDVNVAQKYTTEESIERIKETKQISKELSDSIEMVNYQVNNLLKSNKQIKEIVNLINDISSQINLLSLNAAIESARAGESGKGFSVIANEIGKLSKRTKDNMDIISNIINEIGSDIDTVNSGVEVTYESYKKNEEIIKKLENSFDNIHSSSDKVFSSVNEVIDIISNVEKSISVLEEGLLSMIAVVEETSASTEETSASTEEQLAVFNQLQDIASKLKESSISLNGTISKITI